MLNTMDYIMGDAYVEQGDNALPWQALPDQFKFLFLIDMASLSLRILTQRNSEKGCIAKTAFQWRVLLGS